MFLCLPLPVLRHRAVTPSTAFPDGAVGYGNGKGARGLQNVGKEGGGPGGGIRGRLNLSGVAANDYFRVV